MAIVALGWYSLQPKTSHKTLSIPQIQSATIQIPNAEPDPDAAASLPEYTRRRHAAGSIAQR